MKNKYHMLFDVSYGDSEYCRRMGGIRKPIQDETWVQTMHGSHSAKWEYYLTLDVEGEKRQLTFIALDNMANNFPSEG